MAAAGLPPSPEQQGKAIRKTLRPATMSRSKIGLCNMEGVWPGLGSSEQQQQQQQTVAIVGETITCYSRSRESDEHEHATILYAPAEPASGQAQPGSLSAKGGTTRVEATKRPRRKHTFWELFAGFCGLSLAIASACRRNVQVRTTTLARTFLKAKLKKLRRKGAAATAARGRARATVRQLSRTSWSGRRSVPGQNRAQGEDVAGGKSSRSQVTAYLGRSHSLDPSSAPTDLGGFSLCKKERGEAVWK